jgi:hypothetical protein
MFAGLRPATPRNHDLRNRASRAMTSTKVMHVISRAPQAITIAPVNIRIELLNECGIQRLDQRRSEAAESTTPFRKRGSQR